MNKYSENFFKKAKQKFPHLDFSETEYKKASKKVKVICPEHGEFWITPNSLLSTSVYGCPKCALEKSGKSRRSSTEDFIKKCKEKFDYDYDYSKVEYVKSNQKVCIICPKHGEFWITPNNFLKGEKCPKCSLTKDKNTFIAKANEIHNNKYNYDKVIYNGWNKKVIITCPLHGDFEQTPGSHLNGRGCPICGHEKTVSFTKLTTEKFIKKARMLHGDKYDYSKVNYVNNHTPITIICPKHGEFLQTPQAHLSRKGCAKCNQSHGESEIESILKDKNIPYVTQKKFIMPVKAKLTNTIIVDFYIEQKTPIIIEYNGIQHYQFTDCFHENEEAFLRQLNRDEILRKYCKDNNIQLIEIKYDQNVFDVLNEYFEQNFADEI